VHQELPGAVVVAFDEADSSERRAAAAVADILVLTLAAAGDPALRGLGAQRLLLATPPEGVILVGARRSGPALAREAARRARELCAPAPAAPPAAQALAGGAA
jgi:hypothetical protein